MITTRAIFKVDLNAVRDGDRIATLLRHAQYPVFGLDAGDWVEIEDEDENRWTAVVESVDGAVVKLKIDWHTSAPRSYDFVSEETFGYALVLSR